MNVKERKVLIVDDEVDLANLIGVMLKDHNFQVDIAYTGEEALKKLEHHPDLVLLDRTLPDMEGLEICRRMREDKRFRNVSIVILSGKDTASDKIEGLYVGADDYITKPFDSEELIARLEAVLRRMDLKGELLEEQSELVSDLKNIIDNELITTIFQPIFALPSLTPIGFEAFSRPPQDNPLNNPEFLFKVALSVGMYFELEMLCWKKAFKRWNESDTVGKLFLNCSPYLIESGRFDIDIFRKGDFEPKDIVLELTERIAIQDYASFSQKLVEFRKSDLSIAVDDVGCGFASLNTVAEVKPDFIKIDMPLIRSINKDATKQDIVRAIIDFSHKGNICTIAEGIENEEELEQVIKLGVNAVQGYLLGRPSKEINKTCSVQLNPDL